MLAVRIPPEIDVGDASIIGCAIATGLHGFKELAQLRAGETVLVTGAGGGLGIHSIQVGKVCGATVIAVTSSEAKAESIRKVGADEVIFASPGSDFSERVKALTDGKGVDAVADHVGSPAFDAAFRSLAPYGRYVFTAK